MPEKYRVIIDMPRLRARIKKEEGFRAESYLDDAPGGGTGNRWTWGYGTVAPGPGAVTNEVEASEELEFALWNAIVDYQTIFPDDPVGCTAARKEAIIDMLFNLGITRFLGFKNTISAILAGDWGAAARGIRNSLWYQQVKGRARRIAGEIETGNFGT
jgi:GH24 family phage-related lysozyme (muramidase)